MRNARGGLILWGLALATLVGLARAEVLNPPYFNLAKGRKIVASATCGEGVDEPELYCKLVEDKVCDYCDPNDPKRAHPPEYAIDGTQKFWISPPLSRGSKYNEVNLTIDLGQEFHVVYVIIKMGNSPRPVIWILERSKDNGKTYTPLQYFADTPGDCVEFFGPESLRPITEDDSVICETKFSKVRPLEGGEIAVSLLNERPNADNFSYSTVLQEFTKATNIRLRFIRTKALLGHLMSVARQDPTVTRRYFYSIKDINIGGRCVCNGHAETCDLTDPREPFQLLCRCQHNTCGSKCEECCPGYKQKKWRRAIIDSPFVCEPCNCFGHSNECIYDEEVNRKRLSLDIHGHYDGGGVCQNCRHNTQGINCNECKPTFYRPFGKPLNDTDVCQPCNCDLAFSTGNCADGTGQCECRPEFLPPYCDECNAGYYGYPNCKLCDCNANGTHSDVCEVGGGQCPCKPNYAGLNCDRCEEGFSGFPDCLQCNCNPAGVLPTFLGCGSVEASGKLCECKERVTGRICNECKPLYWNLNIGNPMGCEDCDCFSGGTVGGIAVCDTNNGQCMCKPNVASRQCAVCKDGAYGLDSDDLFGCKDNELNKPHKDKYVLHKNCDAQIHKQIDEEMHASLVYASMAAHFDHNSVARKGLAKFFADNSAEEREHAQKFINYLNVRGPPFAGFDVKMPSKSSWNKALDALTEALNLEMHVNNKLHHLHDIATMQCSDQHLMDFIEGEFLDEQVQSIDKLQRYISILGVMDTPMGEYLFDQQLQGKSEL